MRHLGGRPERQRAGASVELGEAAAGFHAEPRCSAGCERCDAAPRRHWQRHRRRRRTWRTGAGRGCPPTPDRSVAHRRRVPLPHRRRRATDRSQCRPMRPRLRRGTARWRPPPRPARPGSARCRRRGSASRRSESRGSRASARIGLTRPARSAAVTTATTPGGRSGRGGVDAGDAGVGEGTADEGDVERVRERDVGHKAATSHEQARVLLPPNGRSQVRAEFAITARSRFGMAVSPCRRCLSPRRIRPSPPKPLWYWPARQVSTRPGPDSHALIRDPPLR